MSDLRASDILPGMSKAARNSSQTDLPARGDGIPVAQWEWTLFPGATLRDFRWWELNIPSVEFTLLRC